MNKNIVIKYSHRIALISLFYPGSLLAFAWVTTLKSNNCDCEHNQKHMNGPITMHEVYKGTVLMLISRGTGILRY